MITLKMNYAYGEFKRPEVKSLTTFEAIKNRERTSTLRWRYYYKNNLRFYERLKLMNDTSEIIKFVTDIILPEQSLYCKVKSVTEVLPNEQVPISEISKTEGWSIRYLIENGFFEPTSPYLYIQYEYMDL